MSNNTPHRPSLPPEDERIITTAELAAMVPLDRSTIYRMVRAGHFPAPIQLTPARVGWRLSAINAWLVAREKHPPRRRNYFRPLDAA